jgi:hypothetical protein
VVRIRSVSGGDVKGSVERRKGRERHLQRGINISCERIRVLVVVFGADITEKRTVGFVRDLDPSLGAGDGIESLLLPNDQKERRTLSMRGTEFSDK